MIRRFEVRKSEVLEMRLLELFLKGIRFLIRPIFQRICMHLPVRLNTIFISNFNGNGYSDNMKYIVEALPKKRYKIFWSSKNENIARSLPEGIEPVLRNSLREEFYKSISMIWIDNSRKEIFHKKNNQLYIQTWHGGGGQKKIEKDALDSLSPTYEEYAIKDSNATDFYISDSRFMTDLFHNSFWYDGPVLEFGYPRYKVLFDETSKKTCRNKVYDYYGIPYEKKILLYAPTFRKDGSLKAYDVDFDSVMSLLHKKFHEEFVVLIRLHPIIANKAERLIKYDGARLFNATEYSDIQELIAASDIMISDFSSAAFDFCLMRKPVFRYVNDLEEYNSDRGAYFTFDEYPFPTAYNNDDWDEVIEEFSYEEYSKKLNEYFKKIGQVFINDSALLCCELIEMYSNGKTKDEIIKHFSTYLR